MSPRASSKLHDVFLVFHRGELDKLKKRLVLASLREEVRAKAPGSLLTDWPAESMKAASRKAVCAAAAVELRAAGFLESLASSIAEKLKCARVLVDSLLDDKGAIIEHEILPPGTKPPALAGEGGDEEDEDKKVRFIVNIATRRRSFMLIILQLHVVDSMCQER